MAESPADAAHFGEVDGDVRAVLIGDHDATGVVGDQGTDTCEVPLEDPGVRVGVEGERIAGGGGHRGDAVRDGAALVVFGRIHPVDQPVARAAHREERVLAGRPFAVEGEDDLVGLHLVDLVGAGVPLRAATRTEAAVEVVTLVVEELERVVLGGDREPVLLRVPRQAARERPRAQGALVFEAEVPVQPGGVVLLDHEASDVGHRSSLAVRKGRVWAGAGRVSPGQKLSDALPTSRPPGVRFVRTSSCGQRRTAAGRPELSWVAMALIASSWIQPG